MQPISSTQLHSHEQHPSGVGAAPWRWQWNTEEGRPKSVRMHTCIASTKQRLAACLQDVPSPPRNVQVTASGTVSFLPPTSDGGSPVTGYTIDYVPAGQSGPVATVGCDASPCQLTSLTDGNAYDIFVKARLLLLG